MNTTRNRGGRASRKIPMDGLREALRDRRYWVGLGLVYVPNGEPKHWEIDADIGVLVHVQLTPDGEPLMCRLAGFGEGAGHGIWRVPPPGSEVAVAVPAGDIAGDTMIVGVLSTGGVPSELDDDTLVVRGPKVVIIAEDGAVEVGQKGLTTADGMVHGSGVDSFSGATYFALGNTSSTLRSKK